VSQRTAIAAVNDGHVLAYGEIAGLFGG